MLRINAAGDQNLFVTGKLGCGLPAAQQRCAARHRRFVEHSESSSLIGCVRRVKAGGIGTEHQDFAIGEESGAGGSAIHRRFERQRIRRSIEFINGVAGVAAEEEQPGVAQADRIVSRPRRRQLGRIERERLINRRKIFHRVGVTAGE